MFPKALICLLMIFLTYGLLSITLEKGPRRFHGLLVPVLEVEEPILPRVIEGTLLTAERGGPPPLSPVRATTAQQTTCTQGTGRQGRAQQERG